MEIFIYLFAALFSVLNPIGTVPIFVGLTQDYTKQDRSRVSILTAFNVFVILIISFFIGEYVLRFFGITISALRIAGGLIIASSGFSLLNGQFKKNKGITYTIGYAHVGWTWFHIIINRFSSRTQLHSRNYLFLFCYFNCCSSYFYYPKKRSLSS
jgi:hypothetical protein